MGSGHPGCRRQQQPRLLVTHSLQSVETSPSFAHTYNVTTATQGATYTRGSPDLDRVHKGDSEAAKRRGVGCLFCATIVGTRLILHLEIIPVAEKVHIDLEDLAGP
jgi:hypothetical protein